MTDEQSENNESSSQYDRVIDLFQLIFKSLIIINGAASIAILTLIGSILSSNLELDWVVFFLTMGVGAFGFGVLFGTVAIDRGYNKEYSDLQFKDSREKALGQASLSSELRKDYMKIVQTWIDLRTNNTALADKFIRYSMTSFGVGLALCMIAFLFVFVY